MKSFYTLLILLIPFIGFGQINENNLRTDNPFRIQELEIIEYYDDEIEDYITDTIIIDSIDYRILESYIDTVKNNPLAFNERVKYKLEDKLRNYDYSDFENIKLTDIEYANIKNDLFLSIELQESFETNSLIGFLFLISKDYNNARKYYSKAIKFNETAKRIWSSKPYIDDIIYNRLFIYFDPFVLWEKTSQKRKIKNYWLHKVNSIKDSIDFFKEYEVIEGYDKEIGSSLLYIEFNCSLLTHAILNLSFVDNNHRVILKEYVEFCVNNNLNLVDEYYLLNISDSEFVEVFKDVKLELEYKKVKPLTIKF